MGIAIDLGRYYYAQRDLQRMANAAALDAARIAGGCMGIPANPQAAALQEVNESVLRNGGLAGYVTSGSVSVGRMIRDNAGVRSFSAGATEENRAVQVILRRPLPSQLIPIPGLTSDSTSKMTAVAAAQSRPQVSIGVGTTLVNIQQGLLNSLLGGLIGGLPNLSLVSYQGLIAQTVPLGSLADASGQPVDLFLSSPISLRQLLGNLLTAISGVADPVASSGLAAVRDATNPALMVVPGNVISVASGYEDALREVDVSAGQLMMQAAQAVTSNSSINVPANVTLPLLGTINLNAHLITPGQIAVIPAGLSPLAGNPESFASNAQGLLQLNTSLLPILGNAVNLKLFVQAAQATAELEDIHCARRGQSTHRIEVGARTSIARIGIGEFDDINLPHPTPKPTQLLNVLGVKVFGFAYVDVGTGSNQTLTFNGPPFPTDAQRIGAAPSTSLANAIAQLPGNLSITTDPPVVGILVKPVLDLVLAQLTPALTAALNTGLADQVLTPTLDTLGLSFGSADVTVVDVTNDQPYLFVKSR